ncbi:MAG: ABC transporter ATP-binding protein [Candidatus Riflebacteria bacterium]|nr:ABC transporter ATP-binding protein [Candidatus Riflebacteria bacterium]
MIRYEAVTREYGSLEALKGLSLEVPHGSIYALLGPNGAGKTTALRIGIGLTRPTSGTVRMSEVDVVADPIGAKAVAGFLPDTPSYYRHMTGDSFLEFLGQARGLPEHRWVPRREELLTRLDLREARHNRLVNYSFGMLRKIALAGALLHSPPHLLLDEPTAGLDPWSVRSLKDMMLEERARGVALLVSSHDLDAVAEVSDKVGIISGGQLIRELEAGEIKERGAHGASPLESLFLEATQDRTRNT